MAKLKLSRVWPKDLSSEEILRLLAARELNLGKPAEFEQMLRKVFSGEWELFRLDGAIEGVCVLHEQEGRLNIYYLHGEGLFGKISALAEALLDIAAKAGLKGLACQTRDPAKARLFGMVPGARHSRNGDWYLLELDDHGRKTERSRHGHGRNGRAKGVSRVLGAGPGQLGDGASDDARSDVTELQDDTVSSGRADKAG